MIAEKDEQIKIDTVDKNGNKVTYDVVLMYDSDVTDKRYCFYTDGTKNANGQLQLRVGSVRQGGEGIVMEEITNVIEREMVTRDYVKFMSQNS